MLAALPSEGRWRQPPTPVVAPVKPTSFHPNLEDQTIMKSTKCVECGYVGWSDVEHCKACGAPLGQRSHNLPSTPVYNSNYTQWDEREGQKKGLAIFALVLSIISFFTFGLLGVGAITSIILSCIA